MAERDDDIDSKFHNLKLVRHTLATVWHGRPEHMHGNTYSAMAFRPIGANVLVYHYDKTQPLVYQDYHYSFS